MTITPICFLDTETTGVHPERVAWEVAIIRRDENGENRDHFYIDVDLAAADVRGLNIGGYYDRHPFGQWLSRKAIELRKPGNSVDYLHPRAAAEAVARMTHGAHIVGLVPNFDTEVLAKLLHTYGLVPAWHYHLADAETAAVGWLAAQGRRPEMPWKSDELSRACGVEPPTGALRHTAMGDADWAMRWWDIVTNPPATASPEQE